MHSKQEEEGDVDTKGGNLTTHFVKHHLVLERRRREDVLGGNDVVVDCRGAERGEESIRRDPPEGVGF